MKSDIELTIELDPKTATVQQIWSSPQLAVIVPTFNERDNVVSLYDKVTKALGDDSVRIHRRRRQFPRRHRRGRQGTGAAARQCALHPPHRPSRPELGCDRRHFGQRRPLFRRHRRRPPARRAHPARRCSTRRWPATTSSSARATPATARGRGPEQDARSRQPARDAAFGPRHRQVAVRPDERLLPDAPRRLRRDRALALATKASRSCSTSSSRPVAPAPAAARSCGSARCPTPSARAMPARAR